MSPREASIVARAAHSFSIDPDSGTVLAAGDLDIAGAPAFRRVLARAAEEYEGVAVDLSRVTFMDSMGLRELLRVATSGRRIELVGVPEQVRVVLEVAGVEALFVVAERRVDEQR
jgi:anti-sigma B factor antagonist